GVLYKFDRCQMVYQLEDLYSDWELDFKQCSLNRAVRILHHLPLNIFRVSMLFAHALVPSAFRLQVSAMIQESPSKFFLTVSGILSPRHAAHRSKIPTAGVLTPPTARSSCRSSPNGSGTCASNWGMCSIPLPCALPNLRPLQALNLWPSQSRPPSQRLPTARLSGPSPAWDALRGPNS